MTAAQQWIIVLVLVVVVIAAGLGFAMLDRSIKFNAARGKKPRLNVQTHYLARITGLLGFGSISYFVIGALREDYELLPVVAIVMIVFVSALYLLNEYSKKRDGWI